MSGAHLNSGYVDFVLYSTDGLCSLTGSSGRCFVGTSWVRLCIHYAAMAAWMLPIVLAFVCWDQGQQDLQSGRAPPELVIALAN